MRPHNPQLTNSQPATIIAFKKVNMVKKITFYDKTEAIQYQLKMRGLGHIAKIIPRQDKYEVIVGGEGPDQENEPPDWGSSE